MTSVVRFCWVDLLLPLALICCETYQLSGRPVRLAAQHSGVSVSTAPAISSSPHDGLRRCVFVADECLASPRPDPTKRPSALLVRAAAAVPAPAWNLSQSPLTIEVRATDDWWLPVAVSVVGSFDRFVYDDITLEHAHRDFAFSGRFFAPFVEGFVVEFRVHPPILRKL